MIDLSTPKKIHSKDVPCLATLKERTLLTGPSSIKHTYHIALDTANTDLYFQPGDSIAIFPQNDPSLVEKLLIALRISPEEVLIDPRSLISMTAFSYFTHKVNLSKIALPLVKFLTSKKEESFPMQGNMGNHDLIDLFTTLPRENLSLSELCPYFLPLLPRFYSISSSLKTHKDEVHLLVALASYNYKEEIRFGVASHFLCHLALLGSTQIPLYIQPSRHFALPQDPKANIIMIGPGTGVAPYRAFLQERIALGATGKNWLFFGGRYKASDFLYQDFWTSLEKEGQIRLSTAFSRDQIEKYYVQHLLLTHAKEVFQWIEEGAYFYVCGDATHMAKDVEATFLSILQKEGSLSEEAAKAYYKQMKSTKRYLIDVY